MKIDRIIPAVIAASSILLFGCPPKESTGGAAASGEIVIGHLASMTGGQATFGQQTDQGIRLFEAKRRSEAKKAAELGVAQEKPDVALSPKGHAR